MGGGGGGRGRGGGGRGGGGGKGPAAQAPAPAKPNYTKAATSMVSPGSSPAPTSYDSPGPQDRGGPTAPAPVLSFQTEYSPTNVNNPAGDLNVSAQPGTDSRDVTGPTGGRDNTPTPITTVAPTSGGRDRDKAPQKPTVEEPQEPVASYSSTLGKLSKPGGYRPSRVRKGKGSGGKTSRVKDPLGILKRSKGNGSLLG